MAKVKFCMLVDGENIDGHLWNIYQQAIRSDGTSKEEIRECVNSNRTQWDKVLQFAREKFVKKEGQAKFMYFLAKEKGRSDGKIGFKNELEDMGYYVVLLEKAPQAVDNAIKGMLKALKKTDVLVVSNDTDYVEALREYKNKKKRRKQRIALLGFLDEGSKKFGNVENLELFDIERDANAFKKSLPREQPVGVGKFDPKEVLKKLKKRK